MKWKILGVGKTRMKLKGARYPRSYVLTDRLKRCVGRLVVRKGKLTKICLNYVTYDNTNVIDGLM